MAYIIKRIDGKGGYVAKPGSSYSYTHSLQMAHKFATREEADKNRCPGNEVVIDFEELLDTLRH